MGVLIADVLGANPPSYIDRTAFVSAPPFTYGNTQRTLTYDLRNPGYFNQDLSVQRDIPVNGSVRVKLGVEIFNLFNNVVFGGINTNITNANFGRVTSKDDSRRDIQLSLRFLF